MVNEENDILQNEKQNIENAYTLEEEENKTSKKWPLLVLAGLVCLALFISVILPIINISMTNSQNNTRQISSKFLPGLNVEEDDEEALAQLKKLKLIYDFLKDNYYRELSDAEMLEAMYAGLLEEMDSPYTFYLSEEEFATVEESMAGEYSGIGAQVSWQNGVYIITDVFDNSPAAKAGVRNGDQFVSVNGKLAGEFADVNLLATEVRGEEGTTVVIEIFRPSEQKDYTFEIVRGTVHNANLKFEMLENEIGYVRILSFNEGVANNFISALTELAEQGAKTIIFDVRNNGGGYVNEVTRMLDYLLPKGVLAVAKGRSGGSEFEESWDSDASVGVSEAWNYVVLMNEFSASASELFAGCLKDWEKAVLVGENSFGKGVGSVTYSLTDGSAIQITNFHYFLPSGECVQDVGIAPDIEVLLPQEFAGLPLGQIPHEEDTQLQIAIEEAVKIIEGQ